MAGGCRRRLAKREASDVLPSELWLELLLRLPVRTLLILKCVSKTFLLLIQNPVFASLHFSRFSDPASSDLMVLERKNASFADDLPVHQYDNYYLVRRSYTPIKTDEFRFKVHYGTYCGVIGSVVGLFFMRMNTPWSSRFMLCNPLIGKWLLMPPTPSAHLGEGNLGFGYDPMSNDYKVVSILYVNADALNPEVEFEDDDDDDDSLNSEAESEEDYWRFRQSESEDDSFENELEDHSSRHLVEVFSFRESKWRTIGCNVMSPGWFVDSCVYTNGKLHWLGGWDEYYFERYKYYLSHVISFDLGTELFSYTKLPNLDLNGDGVKVDVKVIVSFHGSPVVFCLTARDISFWVMKESNWTTEWTMEWEPKLYRFLREKTCGSWNAIFSSETNELLVGGYFGVVSYNMETKQFRRLDGSVTHVGKYVDSLLWRESLLTVNPIKRSRE